MDPIRTETRRVLAGSGRLIRRTPPDEAGADATAPATPDAGGSGSGTGAGSGLPFGIAPDEWAMLAPDEQQRAQNGDETVLALLRPGSGYRGRRTITG